MDLNQIASIMERAPALVVDTETSGLDNRTDKVVGYVITWGPRPEETEYLPTRHGGGANLDPDKVVPLMRKSLTRPGLRVIGHNLAFDLKMMRTDGIIMPKEVNLECTQINAFLIDERQRFSLDACCKYMGVQEKKGDELYRHLAAKFGGEANRDQMGNYWRLAGNDPIAVDYAIGDGTSTWQLWEKQQISLDSQELRPIWQLESRLIRVLDRMMAKGIKVNEERLHEVLKAARRMKEQEIAKLPPIEKFRSPNEMVRIFSDAGYKDWPILPLTEFARKKGKTEGNPSFPEDWLVTNPLGRQIVRVRKLENLENSFLNPMIETHLWNGRVHANFNQTRGEKFGTVTGRLSCNDPNLQQVPKRNEELGSLFRSIFIPDEGKTWASGDYNQCEPRLLASYGKVKVLLDGYLSDPPIDAHTAVAIPAFGFDVDNPKTSENKAKRQFGKTLNQALLTGAGRGKAASMLGLPMSQADKIVDDYFAAMPEIAPFQKHAAKVMSIRGFVRSLLGRKARTEGRNFDYKAVNRLLQCGNADIIKKAMVDVDEYYESEGDRVNMINNVHDDICHQFYEDDREILARGIELMEDFGPVGKSVFLSVPMIVDVGEGDSWAVATYGKKTVDETFKLYGAKYGS